jgi:hypothetical protein
MLHIAVRQSLRHLAKLGIAKVFVETADGGIEATLLELVLKLVAAVGVVDQQNIGQKNAIHILQLTFGSVLCRNVVGEELLCRFWRMGLRWFGNASRGDTLTFIFDDP